ncbi:unnamed protein product [Arabidopsis thaliana]|uniref:(thale cress) hypothetical protein n=1 Tax=Arabidopsis thaliana TaxID=3702 RepID=A0A7G2EEX4_ARATH|nr:unnamed protein product [Arabidopsis thaliana]
MSGFDCLKLNIKYGGEVSFVDESFTYLGGFEKRDMSMDPDLMTWSIFADFPSENGVSAPVENVWYKLANEDLAYVRAIPEDRDSGIRQSSDYFVITIFHNYSLRLIIVCHQGYTARRYFTLFKIFALYI